MADLLPDADRVAQFKQAQTELERLVPEDKPNRVVNADDSDLQQYREFKNLEVHALMQRPARRQAQESVKESAYEEGNGDYNIWYDKFLQDKQTRQMRVASLYRCCPEVDTGFTKADKFEKRG